MAKVRFTVRVELHKANSSDDYKKLHEYMEEEGFTRFLTFGEIKYELPTAEYNFYKKDVSESAKVLDAAIRAASRTRKTFSVLVTETTVTRSFYGLNSVPTE